MFNNQCCNREPECRMQEVIEPAINKCVEREFFYEVPHVCPIHTHIINKHIYRHTYRPEYSCSEENIICNQDPGSCCNFR